MRDIKELDDIMNELVFEGKAFGYSVEKEEIYRDRIDFFNEFFDTSKMNAAEVYNFIYNSDQENITFRNKLMELLHLDHSVFDNVITRYVSHRENFIIEFGKNKLNFRKFYRDCVKAILWLSFHNSFSNNQMTIEDSYKDDRELINTYINNNYGFYRGQSDFSWQLKPSLLRGFEYKREDGCLIDSNMLYDIYNRAGLINKYNELIGTNEITGGSDIDYEFLSFMQHSISYSPLIDFTSDIKVAYKFALQRNSPNTYLQKDSAVFILSLERPRQVVDFSKLNIVYLNKRIKPGSIMQVLDSNGNIKTLDFTSISKIKSNLCPKYVFFETKTNDRMRYQKGKFILFYNYVSVKGNIYYMLNKQMAIFKRKIKPNVKDHILTYIDSNLNISYLMNPYQVFND